MTERERAGEHEPAATAETPCPACGRSVPAADTKPCPTCGRRVCVACLRPYGHHMLVCDDCRLAEW